MSFLLSTRKTAAEGQDLGQSRSSNQSSGIRWSGAAVLVEAMLLLVFLVASLAVLTQAFSTAVNHADESARLSAAVAAASDTAERFAADPAQAAGRQTVGDLLVVCDVTTEPRKAGTMYHAEIAVYEVKADAAANASSSTSSSSSSSSAEGADANAQATPAIPATEPVYAVSTSRFESEVK